MAWPSGSKAGTTNVDSGADRPADARADIKQNIDNVNAIIDEFNISSPSDGDLLQYSSSTGKWEQVASSTVGGGAGDVAYIIGETFVSAPGGGSSSDLGPWTMIDAGTSGITVSTNNIVVPAGTYIFEQTNIGYDGDVTTANNVTLEWYDNTGSTSLHTITEQGTGVGSGPTYYGQIGPHLFKATISTTSNIILRASSDNNATTLTFENGITLRITKL